MKPFFNIHIKVKLNHNEEPPSKNHNLRDAVNMALRYYKHT